ncbi:hypothetical protein FIM10_01930 [Sphingomonadales bacterium 56]|uniref:hypothetical protein n=2 Tax=unclassified Sphingobium TaxID=2611147 RepID=UPI00191A6DC0|nr:hypothetical protein [Sphingobium sp. S8]MBY2927443.1 hypothetical protein [Sphingomonadales bacterium 56]MBY2957511.1 hypothetical protein [Sphingomonadales bacterium 58]CAD7335226.1 hypothetical protein SPHS6_00391 [Sphingobium sp. S6]MBY2957554.1 hypothetical protein [Sphingomonadales bacterium 58]CAD7335207.1 hypothetical protein SPHS8_00391 [Sphingobium sp. S8]
MSMTDCEFEADLDPETGFPRIRYNFDNGWTASMVMHMGISTTRSMHASVAAWPTGKAGPGFIEQLTELGADEAISWIFAIRQRSDVRREAA